MAGSPAAPGCRAPPGPSVETATSTGGVGYAPIVSKPDPDDPKKKAPAPKKARAKKPPVDPAEAAPVKRRKRREPKVEGLIGIGIDNADGHTRITKGDHFVLLGGSAETHEQMQEFTIKLTERLKKQGKRIPDATIRELRDLVSDLKK